MQQNISRSQLFAERDDLQRLQFQILSDYQLSCRTSAIMCPDTCPALCRFDNPSGWDPQCEPGACVNCASLFTTISSLNASISRVLSALRSIDVSAPPDPTSIYSNASDTCVPSIIQCFNSTNPSALVAAIKSDVQFCVNGNLKFCPLLGCVSQDTPCIPLSSCPADKPKRCPFLGFQDGTPPCVKQTIDCSSTTSNAVLTQCPADQKPCPGGLHCAAASLSESSFFRVRHFNLMLLDLPTHLSFRLACSIPVSPQLGTDAPAVISVHNALTPNDLNCSCAVCVKLVLLYSFLLALQMKFPAPRYLAAP